MANAKFTLLGGGNYGGKILLRVDRSIILNLQQNLKKTKQVCPNRQRELCRNLAEFVEMYSEKGWLLSIFLDKNL